MSSNYSVFGHEKAVNIDWYAVSQIKDYSGMYSELTLPHRNLVRYIMENKYPALSGLLRECSTTFG